MIDASQPDSIGAPVVMFRYDDPGGSTDEHAEEAVRDGLAVAGARAHVVRALERRVVRDVVAIGARVAVRDVGRRVLPDRVTRRADVVRQAVDVHAVRRRPSRCCGT